MRYDLLTTNNAKIIKGRDRGFMVFGLHLSPGRTCPWASPGCLKACLNTAGRGGISSVQHARARKTQLWLQDRELFLEQLLADIHRARGDARRAGLEPAFRLNLTSDVRWEDFGVPQSFGDVQFYDYTKDPLRTTPANYHLTFSRSEEATNHVDARLWSARGGNVAVVFAGLPPARFWGRPVVIGDTDDLRFLDPPGSIIALKAKGRAKRDVSGFVIRLRGA